jgi:Glycosyltransferase 61
MLNSSVELSEALISPFKRPMHPKFNGGLVLGPDANLQVMRHHRWNRPVDHPPVKLASEPERLEGAYLYAGPLMLPFGHFMAESIHRILGACASARGLPLVFAGLPGGDDSLQAHSSPAFVVEVLRLLGHEVSSVRVVTRPTVCERLVVCPQGSNLGGGPCEAYLDVLHRLDLGVQPSCAARAPARSIYVSRSSLNRGSLLGESALEAAMMVNGYEIFRPEVHTVAQQMQAYANAERVVFAEGSACHGVELLGRKLSTVVLLNRRGARNMGMFEAILRPRARALLQFRDNVYVGALPANRTGKPQPHQGVSLIAIDRLKEFFHVHGLADLSGIRHDDYAACARADFDRYVHWALEQGFGHAHELIGLATELRQSLEHLLAGRTATGASQQDIDQ